MPPDLDLLVKLQIESEDLYGFMVAKALDNVILKVFIK
jgi:hypothetical protein